MKRSSKSTAVLIGTLLVVALLASVCSTSDDRPAAPDTPDGGSQDGDLGLDLDVVLGDPVDQVSATVRAATSTSVDLDGFRLDLPSDATAPGDLVVRTQQVKRAGLESAEPVVPVSDFFDVSAPGDGTLDAPAVVTFTLDDDVDENLWPIIYWQDGSESWRALPAEWAPGQTTISATLEHFSGGFLGGIDASAIAREWTTKLTNYFTGRSGVEQPACPNETEARNSGVDVSSDSGDAIKWCFGVEDGIYVLKVANNRRAYTEISYPETWTVRDDGRLSMSLGTVLRALSDSSAELVAGSGRDAMIVAGGDTITLELPPDTFGNVRAEMSVTAYLLGVVLFGFEVYGYVANFFSRGIGDVVKGFEGRFVQALLDGETASWLKTAKECLKSFTDHIGDDLLSSSMVGPILKFAFGCVPSIMESFVFESGYSQFLLGVVLGAIAGAVGLVATAGNLLASGIREIWDEVASLGGKSDAFYDIAVGVDLPGVFTPRDDSRPTVLGASSVMLVVDTSGSMSDHDSLDRVKIEASRQSILDFLAGVEPNTHLGLRTYPDSSQSCSDGTSRFPLGARDPAGTSAIVRTLTPDGDTPTAEALVAAATELEASGAVGGTIVLVSDGESTCDDPCAAAESIATAGYPIQVHAVALAAGESARAELACIADATGGLFADAGDTGQMQDILDELSRPEIAVSLEHPARAFAQVGTADGAVEITATVTNISELDARAAQVLIAFPEGQASVAAPLRSLGNIAPGRSASTTWQFRPGIADTGTSIAFEVVATAQNVGDNSTAQGRIAIADALGRADAGGPLADVEHLVILGDSYSAGEGAGGYLAGTDDDSNTCHRSRRTYLVETFGVAEKGILACSGAVAMDVTAMNSKGVPAQIAQLDEYANEIAVPDAVAMTIGGNDAGFRSILLSCTFFVDSCADTIWGSPADRYVEERLDSLAVVLPDVYASVDAVLNRPDRAARRGGAAPIVVSAYPRILPGARPGTLSAFCNAAVNFSQDELDFASALITDLNGTIEGAVEAARTRGVPAFFVAGTEDAFLPDHTVCDGGNAYVRSPETIGLGPRAQTIADLARNRLENLTTPGIPATFLDDTGIVAADLERRLQEMYHPNEDGYRALTQAILRWTNGDEASAAFPERSERDGAPSGLTSAGPLGQLSAVVPGPDLQPAARVTVQGGGAYQLRLEGFAPGSPIEVTIRSMVRVLALGVTDAAGTLELTVSVPRALPAGDHTLTVTGSGPEALPVSVSVPVSIDSQRQVPWILVGALFWFILALVGALLMRTGRRRIDPTLSVP